MTQCLTKFNNDYILFPLWLILGDHIVIWPRYFFFHICHFLLPWLIFYFCKKLWLFLQHLLWFWCFGLPPDFFARYRQWKVQERNVFPKLLGKEGLRFRFCQKFSFCQKLWLFLRHLLCLWCFGSPPDFLAHSLRWKAQERTVLPKPFGKEGLRSPQKIHTGQEGCSRPRYWPRQTWKKDLLITYSQSR